MCARLCVCTSESDCCCCSKTNHQMAAHTHNLISWMTRCGGVPCSAAHRQDAEIKLNLPRFLSLSLFLLSTRVQRWRSDAVNASFCPPTKLITPSFTHPRSIQKNALQVNYVQEKKNIKKIIKKIQTNERR